MKRAPCPAGVVPAVRTAPAHLTIDDNTLVPGAMALVAVLARDGDGLSRDMSEQSLNVAATVEIQHLVLSPLLG